MSDLLTMEMVNLCDCKSLTHKATEVCGKCESIFRERQTSLSECLLYSLRCWRHWVLYSTSFSLGSLYRLFCFPGAVWRCMMRISVESCWTSLLCVWVLSLGKTSHSGQCWRINLRVSLLCDSLSVSLLSYSQMCAHTHTDANANTCTNTH